MSSSDGIRQVIFTLNKAEIEEDCKCLDEEWECEAGLVSLHVLPDGRIEDCCLLWDEDEHQVEIGSQPSRDRVFQIVQQLWRESV
jgi:MoaA/NifB/PqqE/SkfB family radical SAM enzyme